MPKKSSFFAFYGHFHELFAIVFGVLWRFTCLRVMTKNSFFLHFIGISMSYCPQFWDFRAIYNNRKTRYIFEYLMNYSSFSCFMAIFISYCLYLGFSVGFAWPIRPDT